MDKITRTTVDTSELYKNKKWWPGLVLHFMTYYTTINFILVILYKFTAPYIDLHLSALITAFVSFGICFIHPKEWYIPLDDEHQLYVSVKENNIESLSVYARDLIIHWLPVVIVFLASTYQQVWDVYQDDVYIFSNHILLGVF